MKKLSEVQEELSIPYKNYAKKCRSLLRLICDVPTALANMENFVGPKLGGFCGTIASFISLYELYGSWLLISIYFF